MLSTLSELDLSLIHALQLRPRATWAELAPILGASGPRLARRWAALTARGDAWVTAYPTPVTDTGPLVSMTELSCRFGELDALVEQLVHDRRVSSIEQMARGEHLLLTNQTSTLDEMSQLLLEDLPALQGVESTRTHVAADVHYEGSRWRLDALEPAQVSAIIGLEAPGPVTAKEAVPPDLARGLVEELRADARASAVDLAERVGRPTTTVRRHLGSLLRSRALTLRCDVAQTATRWPVTVTWWCRAPVKDHRRVVELISTRPELRLCLSLTGPANLLVSMWVASLSHLLRVQSWMEANVSSLEILENALILRTHKRMGWELDARGRALRHV